MVKSTKDQGVMSKQLVSPTALQFNELFTLRALRKTWRDIRKELRETTARDVVDWIDWSVSIDTSLEQILRDVLAGIYQPSPCTRIESAKSKGSFRVLTSLNMRDALVYRHICDAALRLALPHKVKGAFYSRRHKRTPVGNTFSFDEDSYERFYTIWLRYNEYRSKTLMNQPHDILVVADISNYFDSIQHDLLFEYLAPLGLPRQAVGLLGRLLEAFRPCSGHSPSPRVGIPVDELDCSRALAHLFLFEHDHRVVRRFNEENYVRWMDDQNIGVASEAEARGVVNVLTRSLAEQRLTLNSGKTLFLDPEDVVVHFQLDANEKFNQWQERLEKQRGQFSRELVADFLDSWSRLSGGQTAERGNWDKILKRAYAFATRADLVVLESRALEDLIRYPYIAKRLFTYFARRNRGKQLIDLFFAYCNAGENLFEDTELCFFESLLFLDPGCAVRKRICEFAYEFATGQSKLQTSRPLGRAAAVLALYWHGESGDLLADACLQENPRLLPKEVARSWLSCAVVRCPKRFPELVGALFGHPSDDVARLVRFIQELLAGRLDSLGAYKHRRLRWPIPGEYYDARAWLLLELASQGTSEPLLGRLKSDFRAFLHVLRTRPELAIAKRVARRVGHDPGTVQIQQ